jgi:mono/diheme cytochrome c family protein
MSRQVVVAALASVLVLGVSFEAAAQAGSAARGQQVFEAQKCSLCHAVAGKGNKNGALDEVGSKLTADEIRAWIVDPAEMTKKHNATRKPPMKSFASLPKEDVDALVAYLLTLRK